MKQYSTKLLLTMLVFMVSITSFAHDFEAKNADGVTIYYLWYKGELGVCCKGDYSDSFKNEYSGDIVIPESVQYDGKTYDVTAIFTFAFESCTELTSIVIPNSVKNIYGGAFRYCRGLTSITIPNSVTFIGNIILEGCNSLETIKVNSENTKYDSRNNCNAIIETSSNMLLAGCKNTIIPNTVTKIGDYAFSGCNSLASIELPPYITTIGDWSFLGCTNLVSIHLPQYLTTIGDAAFYNCSSLSSIIIPDNVTELGRSAFENCNNLKIVTSLNKTAPTLLSDRSFLHVEGSVLQVPLNCSGSYINAGYGNYFDNIVEIDPTGIQDVTLDKNIDVPIFDLNGRMLKEPNKGINIIGGKKVLKH